MPDNSDPTIEVIVRALQAPVDLGPEVEHRVLAILASEPRPRPAPRRLPILLGRAAAIGAIALTGAGLVRLASGRAVAVTGDTRQVELRLDTEAARGVTVVGDFNDWDPQATRLDGTQGHWSTTLRLRPGRYRYTFLVDGARWLADPAQTPAADPDFDRPTSILTVSQ